MGALCCEYYILYHWRRRVQGLETTVLEEGLIDQKHMVRKELRLRIMKRKQEQCIALNSEQPYFTYTKSEGWEAWRTSAFVQEICATVAINTSY